MNTDWLSSGLESEGIYRLSGNSKEVQRIKLLFDSGGSRKSLSSLHLGATVDLTDSMDINVITGVLKRLFVRFLL